MNKIHKKLSDKNHGYSIIELVVAIGIFSLVTFSITSLLLFSVSSIDKSGKTYIANNLSFEAIEAVRAIKDRAWNEINKSTTSLELIDNQWVFGDEGSEEQINGIKRQLVFEPVYRDMNNNISSSTAQGAWQDLFSRKLNVILDWDDAYTGITRNLTRYYYLTNWNNNDWIQTDWSGGYGQAIWQDPIKYDSDNGNINYTNPGQLELAYTYGYSYYEWHFDFADEYTYDHNKIEIKDSRAQLKSNTPDVVESPNSNFNSSTNLSYYDWNRSWWDEVDPSGSRMSSGGNPSYYYRITIPAGTNDEVGGFVQNTFSVTTVPSQAKLKLDWRLLSKSGVNPNTLKVFVFIDKNRGTAPVIGQEAWSSQELAASGVTNWASVTDIDVSSKVNTTGTYYIKMAVWAETPGQTSGQFQVGFDNVMVSYKPLNVTYPTDRPSIYPTEPYYNEQIFSWIYMQENAVKNGGEIYYQISNDGETWKYWNGSSWAAAGSSNYNTAAVVNQYITKLSATQKKFNFKAFLSSNGTQQVLLDSIMIEYATRENNMSGNQYLITDINNTTRMDDSRTYVSFRFTAGTSTANNQIRIYQTESDRTGNYTVGIQDDDGSGEPSGTYLSSGTYNSSAIGWQTINISPAVELVASDVYHIVITRNSSADRRFLVISPKNNLTAYDNFLDDKQNYLYSTNSGRRWTIPNRSPVYVIRHTDNTYEGTPYHTYTDSDPNSALIFGSNQRGEVFSYDNKDKNLTGVAFYVRRSSYSYPEDDLYVGLYNITDNIVVATTTIATRTSISQSYYWRSIDLPETKTMYQGKEYRLYIYSPNTTQANAYRIHVLENVDDPVLNGLNYYGTSARFTSSSNGGSSWQAYNNKDIDFKLNFPREPEGYKQTGIAYSSALFVNSGVFNAISWQSQIPDCSPICRVLFQLKTAPNDTGVPGEWTDTWCGPEGDDGDEEDFYTNASGTIINLDHNGNIWVKYKTLLVGDTRHTPILEEVKLNYK